MITPSASLAAWCSLPCVHGGCFCGGAHSGRERSSRDGPEIWIKNSFFFFLKEMQGSTTKANTSCFPYGTTHSGSILHFMVSLQPSLPCFNYSHADAFSSKAAATLGQTPVGCNPAEGERRRCGDRPVHPACPAPPEGKEELSPPLPRRCQGNEAFPLGDPSKSCGGDDSLVSRGNAAVIYV